VHPKDRQEYNPRVTFLYRVGEGAVFNLGGLGGILKTKKVVSIWGQNKVHPPATKISATPMGPIRNVNLRESM